MDEDAVGRPLSRVDARHTAHVRHPPHVPLNFGTFMDALGALPTVLSFSELSTSPAIMVPRVEIYMKGEGQAVSANAESAARPGEDVFAALLGLASASLHTDPSLAGGHP